MQSPRSARFAQFSADGELLALIAEGLPEWPADVQSLTDEQLPEYEALYLAAVAEIQAGVAADANYEFDVEHAASLAEHVTALRNEAARRLGAYQAELDELAALSEEDRAAVVAYAGGTPEPAAGGDDEARANALAALAGLATPAPGTTGEAADTLRAQDIDPEAIARVAGEAAASAATAAVAPIAEAVTTGMASLAEAMRPVPTRGAPGRGLGAYAPDSTDPALAPEESRTRRAAQRGTLVATADVPTQSTGTPFDDMGALVNAMIQRHRSLGTSSGVEDERIAVARYQLADDLPESRDLRQLSSQDGQLTADARRRILDVIGPNAIGINPWTGREAPIGRGGIVVPDGVTPNLTASGGLAAPVEPYYPQLVLAEAMRIVAGSMPTFIAERGGIRGVTPPTIGALSSATPPGTYTDGVTNTDTSFVSASAAFTPADVGKPIDNWSAALGTNATGPIAAGTVITTRTNATTLVLSAATTATGTGVGFYLPGRNPYNLGGPVGLVTAAQDAAGPPNSVKYTYDVPDGTQYEFDVYSVYTSLQFGNLTARTFPEQVEANILLANALAARTAETQMLNVLTNYSTLFTGAKTFGTARQLLAQIDHMAAYYRNHNRMDPQAVLRMLLPAWCLNAMRSDFISSFMGGGKAGIQGLSDEELGEFFEERSILPGFYLDGPTDVSQLFPSPGSGAINSGSNTATPIAIPDYPGAGATTLFRTEIVSYMWGEGTWLNLTTGELNLGLVRDSTLNSINKFRNFEEVWETPAFVGNETLRCVHTVAADGSYGEAVAVTLGAGSGL